MPLNSVDRVFLQTVDRFKVYLLLIATCVLIFLLLTPAEEMRLVTAVIGVALCGIFWLTQRLLSYITVLDTELNRIAKIVRDNLPDDQRKEFSGIK